MRDATDVETQHQGFYIRNSDDEIATTRSMLLVKRLPAPFYGVAPAKPRGRDVAAEVASLKGSEQEYRSDPTHPSFYSEQTETSMLGNRDTLASVIGPC